MEEQRTQVAEPVDKPTPEKAPRTVPPMADPVAAEAFKRMVAELLLPGEHPEGRPLSELRGVGKCDGVFYLGAGATFVPLPDGEYHAAPIPSLQREALQYLRPMHPAWHAEMYFTTNTKRVGVSKPSADFLITNEMREAAKAEKRPIEWMFTCDEHCIDAVQPEHRGRFKVFKVLEGVWGVLYL